MVYVETQPDRKSAMKRERSIKAFSRAKKESLMRAFHDDREKDD
jgi:predicted GIY-YIG superfamily endonuclease